MIRVHTQVYSPFMENTYILVDEQNNTCVILDPGCYGSSEEGRITRWIEQEKLRPVGLWHTHGHLDHVFGSGYLAQAFDLRARINPLEKPVLVAMPQIAELYGLKARALPEFDFDLHDGDILQFGGREIKLLWVPGHSPGSICFYCKEDNWLIGGDALFRESIGRTDLPLGNHQQLLDSISQVLWPLPDDTLVYPGHGPVTTIGHEKMHNPFL